MANAFKVGGADQNLLRWSLKHINDKYVKKDKK